MKTREDKIYGPNELVQLIQKVNELDWDMRNFYKHKVLECIKSKSILWNELISLDDQVGRTLEVQIMLKEEDSKKNGNANRNAEKKQEKQSLRT